MSLFHADCWDCGDLATCTSIHDDAYLCDNCFVRDLGGPERSERSVIGYLDYSEESDPSEDDLVNDPTWFPSSDLSEEDD